MITAQLHGHDLVFCFEGVIHMWVKPQEESYTVYSQRTHPFSLDDTTFNDWWNHFMDEQDHQMVASSNHELWNVFASEEVVHNDLTKVLTFLDPNERIRVYRKGFGYVVYDPMCKNEKYESRFASIVKLLSALLS